MKSQVHFLKIAVVIGILFCINGCANCPKDPRVDGGIFCSATVDYGNTIKGMKEELEALIASGKITEDEINKRGLEIARLEAQVARLNSDLGDLEDDLKEIQTKIKAFKSENQNSAFKQKANELKSLQDKVGELKEILREDNRSDTLQAMQKELTKLKLEKKTLLGIIDNM